MYRVKTIGNVNVVIADIQVSISSYKKDGILVPKEKIDSSKDAQRLIASNVITIEEVTEIEETQAPTGNEGTVFVAEGNLNTNPSDVFVKQSETEVETVKVEEVTSKEQEDAVDAPAIVAEVSEESEVTEKTDSVEKTVEAKTTARKNSGRKNNK